MTNIFSCKAAEAFIWRPSNSGLPKWQVMLKAALRISIIFFKEFQRDNIPLRSCAMTFTIVLSLVPTLALGTAVLKGLGAGNQMKEAAYHFIDSLDPTPSSLKEPVQDDSAGNTPAVKTDPEAAALSPAKGQVKVEPEQKGAIGLSNHLRRATDQIFAYVDKTDFTTLGAFGVVFLVFAVLTVLGSIEQSMNVIWQAGRGRPFGRKLMDYLALMILLPLSVNLALATETTLQNKALFQWVNDLLPIAWLTGFLLHILPLLMVVGTFTVLYRFLPNTKVRILPAVIGGLAGGIAWFYAQSLYLTLQIGVSRYNAIYGSFATLPLFLVWLYMGWLIFLAGAELSFACQTWQAYTRTNQVMAPLTRLSLAFSILEQVVHGFKEGRVTTLIEMADQLQWPENEIQIIVDILTHGGMLHHVVDDEADGFVPARPEDKLDIRETLDLIFGPRPVPEHRLAGHAYDTARESLVGQQL